MRGFRYFPPEIREKIFEPNLIWESDGCFWVTCPTARTPVLIIALRPDIQLYQEALSLFRRLNGFGLGEGNNMCIRGIYESGYFVFNTKVCIYDYQKNTELFLPPSTHTSAPAAGEDKAHLKLALIRRMEEPESYGLYSHIHNCAKLRLMVRLLVLRGEIWEEHVKEWAREIKSMFDPNYNGGAVLKLEEITGDLREGWFDGIISLTLIWEAENGKFLGDGIVEG